jgi:hypothetical protein
MKQQAVLLIVLSGCLVAQTAATPAADEVAAAVQKAAVRSLNFEQGDARSLNKARPDFTPQGWEEFMKPLQGFLDANGAPQFSSTFVPAGNAVITSNENGVVRLKFRARSSRLRASPVQPIGFGSRSRRRELRRRLIIWNR